MDDCNGKVIMMCSIANPMDVNLEHAFRKKEEVNKHRKWTKT